MQWNDTSDGSVTARYNLTGLSASTIYNVYNDSILVDSIQTDGSGALSFTIAHDTSEHEIRVEQTNAPSYCDYVITNLTMPFTITHNNSYYCLDENIGWDTVEGINFASNTENTTLDCIGYSVSHNVDYEQTGISMNSLTNVTIKNCIVTNFGQGISIDSSNNCTFINNSISSNTLGFYLLGNSAYNNITGGHIGGNSQDFELDLLRMQPTI